MSDRAGSRPDQGVADLAIQITASDLTEPKMTHTHTCFIAVASALAVGCAISLAAGACAAQPLQLSDGYSGDPSKIVTSTHVELSDADLQTSAGARAILQRIEAAADVVCGGAAHAHVAPKDHAACSSDAVDGAVRRLGVRAVKTALADSRREQPQMLAVAK